MPRQKLMLISLLFGLVFSLTVSAAEQATHPEPIESPTPVKINGVVVSPAGSPAITLPAKLTSFRTPAKLYGGAYSVKLSIKRDNFQYELPVWIKPDQKQSTLDSTLLRDMGWVYSDLRAEEVTLSGEKIDVTNFKNQRSEWAGKPNFPKPCCYGVIGQDILKDFQLTFVPTPPAHIEWIRVSNEPTKPKAAFLAELKAIFAIEHPKVSINHRKEDLSKSSYTLDVSQGELIFPNEENSSKPAQ